MRQLSAAHLADQGLRDDVHHMWLNESAQLMASQSRPVPLVAIYISQDHSSGPIRACKQHQFGK
jgi:hypothetical protein